MTDDEKLTGFVVIVAIAMLFIGMIFGATLLAQSECNALDFEHGKLGITEKDGVHIVCEYQLPVPMREIRPSIIQEGE